MIIAMVFFLFGAILPLLATSFENKYIRVICSFIAILSIVGGVMSLLNEYGWS